jgi:hypothetical protein
MRHERSAKADITLPLPRIHSPGRGPAQGPTIPAAVSDIAATADAPRGG